MPIVHLESDQVGNVSITFNPNPKRWVFKQDDRTLLANELLEILRPFEGMRLSEDTTRKLRASVLYRLLEWVSLRGLEIPDTLD